MNVYDYNINWLSQLSQLAELANSHVTSEDSMVCHDHDHMKIELDS